MNTMFRTLLTALLLCASAAAISAGSSDFPPTQAAVSDLEEGRKAVEAKQWRTAIGHLEKALSKDRNNPDIHNWLGYSYRNSGNMARGMEHYNITLKLAPNHKGAHEYIGVAYLLQKNKAKAQEHLAALEKICGKSCEEYLDLQKALAEYKE